MNAAYFLLQDAYAKYVKDYYIGTFGSSVQTYNQKNLKNTTPGEDSADRLWWFQVCTEVAYFQVAPANDSMRSSKVDTKYSSTLQFTDSILLISVFFFFFFCHIPMFLLLRFLNSLPNGRYHLDLCKNVFGEGIYPDVDTTNIYYGGTGIAGAYFVVFSTTITSP